MKPNGHSRARRQPEISCTGGGVGADAAGGVMAEGGFRCAVFDESTAAAKRRVMCGLRQRPSSLTRYHAPFSAVPTALPPCPFLPSPRPGLDWRALHAFRDHDRGAEFYYACLEYGHTLWQRGFAARSLLCLDRAFGAELTGDEPILARHPLPYAAMAWFIAHTPPDVFSGNPRVHFQHYADRMNEPRREQRRWRAWACWALTRVVRPALPSDPRHRVVEPMLEQIAAGLQTHGHRGEVELWREEMTRARSYAPMA